MSRATLISSLLVPAATIGQTMASLCTTNSTTTGTSLIELRLLDHRVDVRRLLGPQTDASHRLGELPEVRDPVRLQVGVGVAALVEQGLPLPDHAETLIVDHRDLDRDPFQGAGE